MIGLLKKNGKRNTTQEISEPSIETEELKAKRELLYDVALKASSVSEFSEILEQILSYTQSVLKASASSLLLVDKEKGKLCFQAAEGKVAKMLRQMKPSLDSGIAGWVARKGMPVVVNDVSRDKRFNKDIDEVSGFITKSIIAVPLIRGRKTIGVLEVLNKADEGGFDERDLAILTGFASTEALILLVSMAHTAINNITAQDRWLNGYKKTAEALAQAIDAKDTYALGHSQRVRDYTMLAAGSLSLSPDELQTIEFGALLHDIGKIGIDESVLRKPGPLNDKEWAIMRQHSEVGANIVAEIPFLEETKPIVLYHHERYDGKGYPQGLKGERIPIGARLVAVCNAFDAMTTEHSYRAALTVEEAIKELNACSGTQFCPVAVKAFVSAMKRDDVLPVEAETAHVIEQKADLPKAKSKNIKKDAKDTPDTDSKMFEGEMELVLSNVASIEQVKHLKAILKNVENLRISMAGWSEDKGHSITISLNEPTPLLKILKEIPVVEKAYMKGRKLVVVELGTTNGKSERGEILLS